jgi:hypothetical protein
VSHADVEQLELLLPVLTDDGIEAVYQIALYSAADDPACIDLACRLALCGRPLIATDEEQEQITRHCDHLVLDMTTVGDSRWQMFCETYGVRFTAGRI